MAIGFVRLETIAMAMISGLLDAESAFLKLPLWRSVFSPAGKPRP